MSLMFSLHQINGTVGSHSADVTSVTTVCSSFKGVLYSQGQHHSCQQTTVCSCVKKLQTKLLLKLTFSFWFLTKDLTVMVKMNKCASLLSRKTSAKWCHIQVARHYFRFH